MNVICTICSNNHLPRTIVLAGSLKKHAPGVKFIVFLSDEKHAAIDYSVLGADEVIPVGSIEPAVSELAVKYSILELSAALKSRAVEYLINERSVKKILYLDSDTQLHHPINHLFDELDHSAILLTPHSLTPVPMDGRTPQDHTFLNYGIYNIGFIGLSDHLEARRFIEWWKERTYKEGYTAPERGLFAEQLPLNLVPVYFRHVKVLEDMGLNMAAWNLHERALSVENGQYFVNGKEPLIFFHFSSFGVDQHELPFHHYNRYRLADRPDLQAIYEAYNTAMKAAGYAFYQQFTSVYATIREAERARIKRRKKWWRKLFAAK